MNHAMLRLERGLRIAAMHVWLTLRVVDLVYWLNGRLGGPSESPYRKR